MSDIPRDDVFLARTKSFTRRSRALPPALARDFAAVEDRYVVQVPRGQGMTSVDPDFQLDAAALFGREAPLVVEVGSGRGEQIVSYASAHPEMDFLAFEVWVPGVARLAVKAAEAGLTNLRIVEADAQQALSTMLPDASVSELWTFFPDPWRKARHHKRRLVGADFASTAARVLVDGAAWRLATDWADYAEQMLDVVAATKCLKNPFAPEGSSAGDEGGGYAPRFTGRVATHFEQRAAEEGRPARDILAIRLPRSGDSDQPVGED